MHKHKSAYNYLFLCVVIEWRKYAVRQKSTIFRNKQVFTAVHVNKHAENSKIQAHKHTPYDHGSIRKQKKVMLIFSQVS